MWEAAASLGSGFLQAGATLWTNNQNMKLQREINEKNYQAQKEFMQNGILWRKQDAERAGINPIYALGASGAQFSPSFQASNMQTPDLQFIGQAIMQNQQFKLEKAQAESIINLNKAKENYYNNLAKEKGGNEKTTPTQEIKQTLSFSKTPAEYLNKAVKFENGAKARPQGGGIVIEFDDQSIKGQKYADGGGSIFSMIPGGKIAEDWAMMQLMSYELESEYLKALKEAQKADPKHHYWIDKHTRTGQWIIRRSDKKESKPQFGSKEHIKNINNKDRRYLGR